MRATGIVMGAAAALLSVASAVGAREPPATMQVGVKHRAATCPIKSQDGDTLAMHYTGKLWDGTKFDSSLDRDEPFEFTLGSGQVISGWDRGLQGMCVGEKRKLVLPPEYAYGDMGAGDIIPPKSTLVFDVELLDIKGSRADAERASEHPDL